MDPFRKRSEPDRQPQMVRASTPAIGRPRETFAVEGTNRRNLILRTVVPPALLLLLGVLGRAANVLLPMLVCAFLFLSFAGALAWRRLTERTVLHEAGVHVHRYRGSEAMAFEEVDEVWYELARERTTYVSNLRLHAHDGRMLHILLGVDRGDVLFKKIVAACSMSLLDDALLGLERGETLTFGSVALDTKQVSVSGASMSWRELTGLRVADARVTLYRSVHLVWRTVKFDEIPHPELFAELARRVGPPDESVETLGMARRH